MLRDEITKNKILGLAENDERIRAVILNGSRANSNVKPDDFQDFDIVFIVEDYQSLIANREWFSTLGNPYLQQLPDEMILGNDSSESKFSFTFLTIFEDGSRIDLTLFPKNKFPENYLHDSLSIVWLDKDSLFKDIPESSDIDYHIKKPTERDFSEVCNEFWWCSTNVAKSLKRNEIVYAKDILEHILRPMFNKMIEWKIGIQYDFSVSIGKSGKFIERYLDQAFYQLILKTYSDSVIENNWESFILMMNIFYKEQKQCASSLSFTSNNAEAENALAFVNKIRFN